jgi:hypothetical protein
VFLVHFPITIIHALIYVYLVKLMEGDRGRYNGGAGEAGRRLDEQKAELKGIDGS